MRFLITGLFIMMACLTVSTAAQADYFVWRHDVSGMTITFPDTWEVVSNQQPDDILTVMAPAGRGHAVCRIRLRADERYMIYPPRYSDAVQKVAFSTEFWDQYVQEYKNARLFEVRDGAGLGRGFAGYAIASFNSAVPGPYMPRRALMFASLYNGDLFILDCSAHKDAFADWKAPFLSIAGSIDFKPAHHQLRTGHYRNFLAEPPIVFKGVEGENYTVY